MGLRRRCAPQLLALLLLSHWGRLVAAGWRYQTGNDVYSSPAVSGDGLTVYVGSYDNYLHAVDASTGAP